MKIGSCPWISTIVRSSNQKILLMLSGGVDSILCLAILNGFGLDVTAIHFIHEWSWDIPTRETRRICRDLDVELVVVDISKEFRERIVDKIKGRPCSTCKTIMEEKALEHALSRGFGWICIGDTNDDVAFSHIHALKGEEVTTLDFFVGTYLFSNPGAGVLPGEIKILRPIIHLTKAEVVGELHEVYGIPVKSVHEAGDPWVTHRREGCPLHYINKAIALTEELASELKILNDIATSFARANKIRAAVRLPDREILLIPRDEGMEARLEKRLNLLARLSS
ncbi:MAG: 7-cyano-7-deazaguanine synthase [Promethearchaeota archaeon]